MSMDAEIVLFLVVTVAALVQGTSGLGFALIIAPIIGFLDPTLLPVFLLALMLPLNLYITLREWRAIDFRGAGWITLTRVLATPGGIGLLLVIPEEDLGLLIGIATVIAALASLMMPAFNPGRLSFMTAGFVTGLSETATGIGGPPLALVYQHRPATELRATIALCFFVGEVVSLLLILTTSHPSTHGLIVAMYFLPAVILGAGLSLLIHQRVAGSKLRMFVLAFATISGFILILR